MLHYIACGLSNIWLTNGYKHGGVGNAKKTFISDVADLHRLIGNCLINRRSCLVSAEMRFLRHEMKLSRRSLGDKLGVDPAFINQWEQHNSRLPRIADVSLRALYASVLLQMRATELSVHILSDAECEPCADRLLFNWSDPGWRRG